MKTEREVYSIMDMVRPHLNRIILDIGDDGIGLAINCEGGTAILYEQEKGKIYEHHMRLNEDMVAFDHKVVHGTEDIDEYHAEIDRAFDKMMGADEWGGFVGVIQ